MRKLPKIVRLPGCPRVAVKEAPPKDVAVAASRTTDAFYDHAEQVIWVRADYPLKTKWKLLLHEFGHLYHDTYEEVLEEVVKPWGK